MVWRGTGTEQPHVVGTDLYLLYGDAVLDYQPAEGLFEGWVQYTEGPGVDGTHRQDIDGGEYNKRGGQAEAYNKLRTPN